MGTKRLFSAGVQFLVFVAAFGPAAVYADQFTSADYRILDPVMNAGGYGSSANFTLSGSLSEIANGTSTSSSFGTNASFLYFPLASTPLLSITGGDGRASLSWTASTGYLGWTAREYAVAQSTVAGGPYLYTATGSELSLLRTGLSNGTQYYFAVVAKDAFGNAIATSTESSVVPAAPSFGSGSGGGGGGGGSSGGGAGGAMVTTEAKVLFTGKAYPKGLVTLLRDGQRAATVIADDNADFQISLSGLSAGNYLFSMYAEDKAGRRSPLLSLPVATVRGETTVIGPILIAPTVEADKVEVRQGGQVVISGTSVPGALVLIAGTSRSGTVDRTKAGQDGAYAYALGTSGLDAGKRSVQSKASRGGAVSPFSQSADFIVGTKNAPSKGRVLRVRGDLNKDGRVDIVDFSIMSYWYERPLVGRMRVLEKSSLNGDGVVNMVDFSIMAFYWTG